MITKSLKVVFLVATTVYLTDDKWKPLKVICGILIIVVVIIAVIGMLWWLPGNGKDTLLDYYHIVSVIMLAVIVC